MKDTQTEPQMCKAACRDVDIFIKLKNQIITLNRSSVDKTTSATWNILEHPGTFRNIIINKLKNKTMIKNNVYKN